MSCYDKGVDKPKGPRLTSKETLKRKEAIVAMLKEEIHYKKIAKKMLMAPSVLWIYIKRMENKGELVLDKPLVKEPPTYGRPKKAKILPFSMLKLPRGMKRKGKIGDKVAIEYKNKSFGRFSNDHCGHKALILKSEHKVTENSIKVRFMYLIQCEECEDSKSAWVLPRSFEKIQND